MPHYHYRANLFKQEHRHKRAIITSVAVLGLVLFGAVFIFIDNLSTGEIEQAPGTVLTISDDNRYTYFDDNNFGFRIFGKWERAIEQLGNHTVYRYRNVEIENTARSLDIYIGGGPATLPATRALGAKETDDRFEVGDLSPPCHSFVNPALKPSSPSVQPPDQKTAWLGLSFLCNFSTLQNIVLAVSAESGYVLDLKGRNTSGSYTFVYTDHTVQPNLSIFGQALASFRQK